MGFEYYDAQLSKNSTRIYINHHLAFKARKVRGDPSVFKNGETLELKAANSPRSISPRDMDGRELARSIVQDFNLNNFVTKKAYINTGLLLKISEKLNNNNRLDMSVGDYVFIDKKIDTVKFNSNNGWSAGHHDFPDFLSHWSYVNSGGAHLLCNLKGHRGVAGSPRINDTDNYYLFQDPVILSRNEGSYGLADTGQSGIDDWLNHHECNWLCKHHNLSGGASSSDENPPSECPY